MSSESEPDAAADVNLVGVLGSSVAILVFVALIGRKEPNQGLDTKLHFLYFGVAACAVILLPSSIAQYVFTELSVTLVGALYPIFRATKAVCTPEEDDDKSHILWSPRDFALFRRRMSNFIAATIQLLTNAAHLYFVWIIFMFLPAGVKRICAIAIGTVYPFVCSVTATATEEIEDDTYWLTYWAGLQELLILRDTVMIKKQMLRDLEPERAKIVEQQVALMFGSSQSSDPSALKSELKYGWEYGWGNMKIKNPFSRKKDGYDAPPGETSKLNPIV
ncbi:hypothetical protein THAOC_10268 [Thalassiosira oceanica]|uniref:Uncharacterized protein n=1 Tax=Thalassiosira oceanica TaxID=159749 RepID=K0T5D9_THAOC|nr:hypothetical protein THAOC_10268 [Thalassiosira oceanica]|eukprot:EJK68541.1 hypothetical protein THAOC_10268 [Thalassiosira oceanica]